MINQFINTLKKSNQFQNLIFFFILYSFIFIKLNNILSLSGNLSNLEQVNEVSNLISTNYIDSGFNFFSVNKIYKVFVEKQNQV